MTERQVRGSALRTLRSGTRVSLREVSDRLPELSLNDLSRIELGSKEITDEQYQQIDATIRSIARERLEVAERTPSVA